MTTHALAARARVLAAQAAVDPGKQSAASRAAHELTLAVQGTASKWAAGWFFPADGRLWWRDNASPIDSPAEDVTKVAIRLRATRRGPDKRPRKRPTCPHCGGQL